MRSAALPTPDQQAVSLEEHGERVLLSIYGYRSSYDLYCSAAKRFGLSFSDYAAIVLARVHGLPDPSWTHVGRLDISEVGGVQLQLAANPAKPADIFNMRARTDVAYRQVFKAEAAKVGVSLPKYLGYVLSYVHGEPAVVDLNLGADDKILLFSRATHEVKPGLYEARAS